MAYDFYNDYTYDETPYVEAPAQDLSPQLDAEMYANTQNGSAPDVALDSEMYAVQQNGSVSLDDLRDSLSMAFGGSLPAFVTDTYSSWSAPSINSAAAQTVNGESKTEDQKSEERSNEGSGMLSKMKAVSQWIKENPDTAKILAGSIGGAVSARNKKAEIQGTMDAIRLKDQLQQEANARHSDSIKGLRQPTGMLYKGPLKRKDGTQVYNNGKILG